MRPEGYSRPAGTRVYAWIDLAIPAPVDDPRLLAGTGVDENGVHIPNEEPVIRDALLSEFRDGARRRPDALIPAAWLRRAPTKTRSS